MVSRFDKMKKWRRNPHLLKPKAEHKTKAVTPEVIAEIQRLRADGLILRDIAAQVGVCEATCCKYSSAPTKSEAREPKRIALVARNQQMQIARDDGMTVDEIAERFSVSRTVAHANTTARHSTLDDALAQFAEERENGCLVWTGPVDKGGYPRWADWTNNHFSALVHRAVYQRAKPLKSRQHVVRICGQLRCVNLAHMKTKFPGNLTREQVARLLRLHRSGATWVHLAKMFDVSNGLVSDIIYGQSWEDVE